MREKNLVMKVTMIKKTNTIISLWIIAIVATLAIFAYELNMFGFLIADAVLLVILLCSNVFTIIYGFINSGRKAYGTETEYNKF